MTVYRPKGANTDWYDFWFRGERYRANTWQTDRTLARIVEAQKRQKLREQAGGIAVPDAEDSPAIHDFAEHYQVHADRRLRRPDRVEDNLRVVLRFWGRRPSGTDPKNPIVEGEPYHDLRLLDPIMNPDFLTAFETWMEHRTVRVHKTGEAPRTIGGQTRNQYRSTMSELYKLAMQPAWRKRTGVTMNPFAGLYRDQTSGREVALEPEDVRRLLEQASYHVRLAIAIGALAPKLRLANILSLEWTKHLDAKLTFITVPEHKTRTHTARPLVIPISDQLREILEDARRRAPGDYVVTYRGRPLKEVRMGLQAAAARAGLTYGRFTENGLTFHTLRHTAATIMLDIDVPRGKRRRVMGHTTDATTEKYEHLRPVKERGPVEQLSRALPIQDLVTATWRRASNAPGTPLGTTPAKPGQRGRSDTTGKKGTRGRPR